MRKTWPLLGDGARIMLGSGLIRFRPSIVINGAVHKTECTTLLAQTLSNRHAAGIRSSEDRRDAVLIAGLRCKRVLTRVWR